MEGVFYIQKRVGSYGDALAAIGFARLLSILYNTKDISLEEFSGYFLCKMDQSIDLNEMDVEEIKRNPGFPYIQFDEDEKDAPSQSYKYYREQELYRLEREKKKKGNAKKDITAELSEENVEQKASKDYLLIQSLRVMQGTGASNKLYKTIQEANSENLKITLLNRLILYSKLEQDNPIKEPFSPSVSAVQAFNPVIGKGVNKTKATSVSVGSFPSRLVDWFEEWMRFIGGFQLFNAHLLKDDLKFVAVVPHNLNLKNIINLREIFFNFRDFSSRRSDIILALNLVEFLVENSKDYLEVTKEKKLRILRKTPRDVISGISSAYFKSLGNGKALINNSFIAFPDWFPFEERQDAIMWLEVVAEHKKILRSLDESKTEELILLQKYRDFLSSTDWSTFFDYMTSYASLYMQRVEQKNYAVQHSLKTLEGVCKRVSKMYGEIIMNDGFKEVAKAMREATVSEQWKKSKKKQQYEVHYGLFQEIKRKAKFNDQVINVICEFISDYNRETARKMEQTGEGYKGRRLVSIDALEQLISLFEKYPKKHETIALMLVAAASCYDGKTKGEKEEDGNA